MRHAWLWMVLLGWATHAGAAGVYKWVDDAGRVHYGEHPLAAGQAQEMQIKESPPAAADPTPPAESSLERQQRLLRAFEEERALKKEAQEKARAEKKQRTTNCGRARDRLRVYTEAGRLYDVDGKGERRILSSAERDAAMKRAQEDLKRWCQ